MADDKAKRAASAPAARSYRDTLNLPDTPFPMRGDLAKREPQRGKRVVVVRPKVFGLVHMCETLRLLGKVQWKFGLRMLDR